MSDSRAAIPEQLELTGGMIRALLTGVTEQQIDWKPKPERFSIAEVLAHLAHAEQYAYRVKYELFATEDDPPMLGYNTDRLVASGAYSGLDGAKSLREFEELRRGNLELLRSAPEEAWTRVGRHSRVGDITLSNLLNECAYHDLGHVRQIAELVRAQKYYPNSGVYQRFYTVNP